VTPCAGSCPSICHSVRPLMTRPHGLLHRYFFICFVLCCARYLSAFFSASSLRSRWLCLKPAGSHQLRPREELEPHVHRVI
jgi:hypothetical protein